MLLQRAAYGCAVTQHCHIAGRNEMVPENISLFYIPTYLRTIVRASLCVFFSPTSVP
eukprot:COSAG02_NODE_17910_length_972_cov_0.919817_2_plen_56_part_01